MLGTRKYPPAEPGALGIEPLKAAEFGAAEAAPRWWLGRFSSSFVPATWPHLHTHCQLDLGTWDKTQGFALLMHLLTMRSDRSMRSPSRALAASQLEASSVGRLQEMSNYYCHPGRAGGSPGYARMNCSRWVSISLEMN